MIQKLVQGSMMLMIASLGACASINSLTRAKTLKAGEKEFHVGVEYSNLLRKMDGTDTDSKTFGVDLAARYGATDDDEIGLRLVNSFAYGAADYKRALLKGDTNVSMGALVGYLSYEVGSEKFKQIDLGIPFYIDHDVSSSVTLLASPKFQYSIVSGTGAKNYSSIVLSGGARFGTSSGLHLEFGYGIPFLKGMDGMWQANAGLFF